MDNIQKQADKLKNRIEQENKFSNSNRRVFSRKLKQDIVQFAKINDLKSRKAAMMIGVGPSTLERWILQHKKDAQFREVKIANKTKQSSKESFLRDHAIKTNQYVLMTLTALLLIERLFPHLVS